MLTAFSDEDLALRYREGDLAAFEELYRRHSRGVYGFIDWCSPHRDRIDEVVLDCWATLHQARGRYLASASFRTFLYQVARSRLADAMRHDLPAPPLATMAGAARDVASAAEPCPRAVWLGQAIRALPDEERDILMLRHFSGLGPDELALLCAAPLDSVETRLRDALGKLRAQSVIDAIGADPDMSVRGDGTRDDGRGDQGNGSGAILRGLPQHVPPADLDARIHAQARAALDHPARVVHDSVISAPPADADGAADDEEAPRPSNPFGHLRVPMAVAAVLVIGVTLALQLGVVPAGLPSAGAGDQGGKPVPAYDERDPAGAMARISALLDQHRDAEARDAWRAFRELHPDAPVPDALRARLDALPPAR
ncbi:sigma-70 family RNA polymerase sigma factor [Massilia sp. 9096]|uniref:sigma-70 family RNA polymerase sigma factor n=1 Tax=Massilia sp. 9096 TaxID=1500894 RepID=UPI00069107BD|nr:sigma-70 family RNA polymerase sigma factor [Massilia sp. 9096]